MTYKYLLKVIKLTIKGDELRRDGLSYLSWRHKIGEILNAFKTLIGQTLENMLEAVVTDQ